MCFSFLPTKKIKKRKMEKKSNYLYVHVTTFENKILNLIKYTISCFNDLNKYLLKITNIFQTFIYKISILRMFFSRSEYLHVCGVCFFALCFNLTTICFFSSLLLVSFGRKDLLNQHYSHSHQH